IVQTDDTGAYRFSGLPPETYVVQATPGVIRSFVNEQLSIATTGQVTSRIYYPGAADLSAAQRIVIQQADEKTGISFAVPAAQLPGPPVAGAGPGTAGADTKTSAVIRGRVLRAGGTPAASVRVVAVGAESQQAPIAAATDPDGVYTLTIPDPAAGP